MGISDTWSAMEKVTVKVKTSGEEEALLGGDDEIVPSTTQKQGILFIEARIREDVEEEVDTATVFYIYFTY
jgi:hypothetical protein